MANILTVETAHQVHTALITNISVKVNQLTNITPKMAILRIHCNSLMSFDVVLRKVKIASMAYPTSPKAGTGIPKM